MAGFSRRLAAWVGMGGLTLLLLPESFAQISSTLAQPSPAVTDAPRPLNMLQQPARDAQVDFAGDRLSIHADNSSLGAILRQVAAQSGMKITGLGSDERVFGSFGPGSPSDVLADLLNGTAYDLVLIGNASHGAPRELILTPSHMSGQAQAPAMASPSQGSPDDAVNDQESQDGPPPPDVPPPGAATPPGVRTPQQLFQQLQQMRQAQQQQIPQQDQQQQPPQ